MKDFHPWPNKDVKKFLELGIWEDITIYEKFKSTASKFSSNIAIICGEKKITYQELNSKVEDFASGVNRFGIKSGQNVLVQLPNCLEFFIIILGLAKIGVRPVLTLLAHREKELNKFIGITGSVAYFIKNEKYGYNFISLARNISKSQLSLKNIFVIGDSHEFNNFSELYCKNNPIANYNQDASSVALFQLSGGTTGVPKLIPRTHNDYIYSINKSIDATLVDKNTVYLVVLPQAHNFPLSSPGSLGVLFVGGKIVLSTEPRPGVSFPLIEKEKITMVSLVPSIAILWLNSNKIKKFDLSSLKLIQVGGQKLNYEIATKIPETFLCRLQQVYGMAEGLVCFTNLTAENEELFSTQGKPMSLLDEALVVDEEDNRLPYGKEGHLLTRGPYTIRGYFADQEINKKSFTKEGYYRTGDMVVLDKNRNIVVTGRFKDQINRGGEKIACDEIENIILSLTDIIDVAVVGFYDYYLGEKSCAFIISNNKKLDEKELISKFKLTGIASFKIPDRFVIVNELPKTAVGKIDKKKLRSYLKEKRVNC